MPNRPATFKTEQLKTPDSDWDNVVVTYDGVTVKTFVNGNGDQHRYETEITKTGLTIRRVSDRATIAKIPVILDENVPEDKVYVFNGSDNLEEINKAKKLLSDRGILNHDDIAEAAGSIWDSTITPSVAKLNHVHVHGNHDGFTKEAYHVNYNDHNSNLTTAEEIIKNWQTLTVEEQRKKARELLENTFIKPELLKKHYNIDILAMIDTDTGKTMEQLLKESEKAKEQPTEFYKNLKKGVFGSTLDYKMIPDEPEGKSLNMWLRNIVTDDKD
jgi:hypothetical protein